MDNPFGGRLRQLRKQRRLTRDELGEILGVSGNAVTAYETSKRNPRKEVIDKICDYCDVRYDWMTGASEYKTDAEFFKSFHQNEQADSSTNTNNYLLKQDEEELLLSYRILSPTDRNTILAFVRFLRKG